MGWEGHGRNWNGEMDRNDINEVLMYKVLKKLKKDSLSYYLITTFSIVDFSKKLIDNSHIVSYY